MPLLSRAIIRFTVVAAGFSLLPGMGTAQTGEIIRSILGRPLSNAQVTHAYIFADGSLEGVFNGISFAGTWTLENGKYCRKFTRGLTSAPICMSVRAEYAPDGEVRAVIFEGAGGRARFDVGH